MNVDFIRRYCLSFFGAKENLQWGDDLCFKVEGKIFAILGLGAAPQKLCFKCAPETFTELVEREGIVPAPYLGRYKWVLLERLEVLPRAELEVLIGQSYELVAAKTKVKGKVKPKANRSKRLPRKKR